MKKRSVLGIVISAAIYLLTYVLASSYGLIHPACYAYAGTFVPLLFSFIYLYTAASIHCFGAAFVMNCFVVVAGTIAGEGNPPLYFLLFVITAVTEFIRSRFGYDTIKGVRWSFIPFAFSFYAYSAHWWTNTAESLAEAVEEMPAGYADKMAAVISNKPVLIIMLILTIPVAVFAIRIAEKVMKKQAARLK